MVTYLGLAHIRPYGFDLDRLDGLGGWVGGWDDNIPWTCTHTTHADLIWIGWMGWVGGGGWDDNVPWTCTHTTHARRGGGMTCSCRCR